MPSCVLGGPDDVLATDGVSEGFELNTNADPPLMSSSDVDNYRHFRRKQPKQPPAKQPQAVGDVSSGVQPHAAGEPSLRSQATGDMSSVAQSQGTGVQPGAAGVGIHPQSARDLPSGIQSQATGVGIQPQSARDLPSGTQSQAAVESSGQQAQHAGADSVMASGTGGENLSDLNIIVGLPNSADFSLCFKRFQTFRNCMCFAQKPESLAEAGFFDTGKNDRCKCFHCGVIVSSWTPHDDPWIEHARWSSSCFHVISNKGQEFVSAVQALVAKSSQICSHDVEREMRRMIQESQDTFLDTSLDELTLVDDVQDDQEKSDNDTTSLMADFERENENMQMTCKVCFDADVRILFLPCGHLVTCAQCAAPLQICPLCRQTIRGRVAVQI